MFVVPGPVGVGGELDGHAAGGDALELVFHGAARARRAALRGFLILQRGVHGSEQGAEGGHFGLGDAGQGVRGQLLNDALGVLAEQGDVLVQVLADEIVAELGWIRGEILLARGGLHFLQRMHEVGLGHAAAQGRAFLGGRALNGVGDLVAGRLDVVQQGGDELRRDGPGEQGGGVGGLLRGQGDLLGLVHGLDVGFVDRTTSALFGRHAGIRRGGGIRGWGWLRHRWDEGKRLKDEL